MDCIKITGLKVYAYHGVFDFEQQNGQEFFVNLCLYGDCRAAGQADDLNLSTDYGDVCHKVTEWMTEKKYKLIEAVSEEIAQRILLTYPLIQKVRVEVEKPQAPVGLPFENVSVTIDRGWHKVYLSIGSNMGDSEQILREAIRELESRKDMRNVKASAFLVTKPYGGVEQPDFLNGAVQLETLQGQEELLQTLHEIEKNAGRERIIHWGPRTLDLDIVFYDDLVYESDDLIIPHVDMENRYFVLQPLSTLCPHKRHPILGKTVEQLLRALQDAEA